MMGIARALGSAALGTATLFACSERYVSDEAPPPAPDAGDVVADASPSRPFDAAADANVTPLADSGADAEIDAGFPFRDPSFQTMTEWQPDGGAMLFPSGQGAVDLGFASLVTDGRVAQTTTIPAPTSNGLAIRYRYAMTYLTTFKTLGAIGVFADGQSLRSPVYVDPFANGIVSEQVCLGEAALGAPRNFEFRALDVGYSRIDLDFVEVIPATCPTPGVLLNGDFEASEGWTFAPGSIAKYSAGTGAGGGRSLRFEPKGLLAEPRGAFQALSIPKTSLTAPALEFKQAGVGVLSAKLDGAAFAISATTTTSYETRRYCFPAWARGIVSTLTFEGGPGDNSLYGSESTMTVDLDDVKIVDDPKCAGTDLLNRDFEEVDPTLPTIPHWAVYAGSGFSVTRQTDGAHSGNAYMSMRGAAGASCADDAGQAHLIQTAPIPDFDPNTAGIRLGAWYRLKADTFATVDFGDLRPEPAATWTKISQCFRGARPGVREVIMLRVRAGGSCVEDTVLDVDDVVLELAPECK